jgi:transcriptional regulator with XRE-family HTH domain
MSGLEGREAALAAAARRADALVEALIVQRKALELSQGKLAEQMGLHKQVISRNESRGGAGNLVNFIEWAAALGYDVALIPNSGGRAGGVDDPG